MYTNYFRHKPVDYELNGKKIKFYVFNYEYYKKKFDLGKIEN